MNSKEIDELEKVYKKLIKSCPEDISLLFQVAELIENTKDKIFEKQKVELLNNGYEARIIKNILPFGLNYPDRFPASNYCAIICHKDCPSISEIRQVYGFVSQVSLGKIKDIIYCSSGVEFDTSFILGHGQTEAAAWNMAVYNWNLKNEH